MIRKEEHGTKRGTKKRVSIWKIEQFEEQWEEKKGKERAEEKEKRKSEKKRVRERNAPPPRVERVR